MSDLFGDQPVVEQARPLKKIAAPPPEVAPAEPCACGSTEWWVGTPCICKKCKTAYRPPAPVAIPQSRWCCDQGEALGVEICPSCRAFDAACRAKEKPQDDLVLDVPEFLRQSQNSLPGFPSDPIPHAKGPTEAEVRDATMEMREALRRIRERYEVAEEPFRSALGVVLARLEPEYPEEAVVASAAAAEAAGQVAMFELGAAPPKVEVVEPIVVYVHFENAVDLREFGRRIGVSGLSPRTRSIGYSRDRAIVTTGGEAEVERGERDKKFGDVQTGLFGEAEWWEPLWRGMPAFEQRDLAPVYSIEMKFESWDDVDHFEKVVDQTVPRGPKRTPSIWFPEAEIGSMSDKRFLSRGEPMRPRAPIYIVSKGRYETRLTSDSLHAMGVPHFIVVEEHERELYAARIKPWATLITLDQKYKEDYDACDDLGMTKSKGPGPARNFAWDHSIKAGHRWHWVMDDNIDGFFRLFRNIKTPCKTGAIFRAMEDWCDRYDNVTMGGPNYFMFASRKTVVPPLTLNTRIYSCNLIRNDSPFRWRGRYNEDTDISLMMLKAGLVTAQFNAFLQMKLTTQTLGGGNTAEFYAKEGTRPKSEMLAKMHPDVARVVYKWGRWHHHVDYRGFRKNQPKLREGVPEPSGVDDFGMELEIDEKKEAA